MAKYTIGQTVIRMLAGRVPMELKITEIKETSIMAGLPGASEGWWEFDIATGAEIDEDLKWGPAYGITGSYLKEPDDE